MACASTAPAQQPDDLHENVGHRRLASGSSPRSAWTKDTAGLKWAPLTGPNNAINVARTATVAPVFAMSATARFPAASRSAMIPEPITVAASSNEPKPSAARRRSTRLRLPSWWAAVRSRAAFRLQRHLIERAIGNCMKSLIRRLESLKRLSEGMALSAVSAFAPPQDPRSPQCAVMGLPGHIGQTSPAALSQTVKMKSRWGAPGAANSSQLLLRSPSDGSFMRSTVRSRGG